MQKEYAFYELTQKEKQLTRKVSLANDTRYLCCVPDLNCPGEFLRVEQQSNVKNETFYLELETDGSNDAEIKKVDDKLDVDMKISKLKLTKQSKQLETYN